MGISYTHAQTMKKLIHTQDFENRLAKEAQTMQSIESDFTQVKYLDILDEKVTSKESSITKRVAKYVWNTPNPSTT